MRIFLSYASEDRTRIEPIRLALVGQGHDIFYDREDLKPGEAFDAKIRAAIERCDLFVCFLTPHTVDAGSYGPADPNWSMPVDQRPNGRLSLCAGCRLGSFLTACSSPRFSSTSRHDRGPAARLKGAPADIARWWLKRRPVMS
jgi:hypothetical protein